MHRTPPADVDLPALLEADPAEKMALAMGDRL
jgi:hypothetical protein